MLKGRFSKSWSEFQDAHLGQDATKAKNGKTWMATAIDTLFKEWWKLWELRNSDRHGKDDAAKIQATKAQALRDLRLFYDTHMDKVQRRHRWLFAVPFEHRMTWTTSTILQWIHSWGPALEKSYTTALETG
jgi:hypothetical protein